MMEDRIQKALEGLVKLKKFSEQINTMQTRLTGFHSLYVAACRTGDREQIEEYSAKCVDVFQQMLDAERSMHQFALEHDISAGIK